MEIPVYENLEQYTLASPSSFRTIEDESGAELFILKLTDDALSPLYPCGSEVIFTVTKKASSGDIVIASVSTGFLVRKIEYEKDFLTLKALNDAYESPFFGGVSLGKVKVKAVARK